jgi:hypothetical protein
MKRGAYRRKDGTHLNTWPVSEAAQHLAAKPDALIDPEVRDALVLALWRIEDLQAKVDLLARRSAHRNGLEGGGV